MPHLPPERPVQTPRADMADPVPGQVSGAPPPVTHLPRGMPVAERGALPLSGLTVLLVEDSRFTSDALRLMCQHSGARMRRAASLEQARAHLHTYRPDVVIVDLGLPDGRGEDLIRQIAGSGPVVLAASGDPAGRSGALRAGAQGFLEKPLPGLSGFQKLILRYLPDRFAIPSASTEAALADPMALHDDLRHAAALLSAAEGPEQRRYLAGFLAGLARSTGDAALARAAAEAAERGTGLADLQAAVQARLNRAMVI